MYIVGRILMKTSSDMGVGNLGRRTNGGLLVFAILLAGLPG